MEIKWKKDLETGIQQMDLQHMKLISLMNKMCKLKSQNKARNIIEFNLWNLVDCFRHHFSMEELFMMANSFPSYDSHKAKHQIFFEQINFFKFEYFDGNSEALDNIITYLNVWMPLHIMSEDKKYGNLLNQKSPQERKPVQSRMKTIRNSNLKDILTTASQI